MNSTGILSPRNTRLRPAGAGLRRGRQSQTLAVRGQSTNEALLLLLIIVTVILGGERDQRSENGGQISDIRSQNRRLRGDLEVGYLVALIRARLSGWLSLQTGMINYPVPANEVDRLRALRSYKILDTKPEEHFDELTGLAALICDVPISLISLIDSNRQWFKSRFGLDLQETPRAQAFCTHAIMQPEMFVVPDAAKDERFAQNPLVTGDLHVRFYAGAPLASRDGHLLGTLCVIDHQPHTLTDAQRKGLEILSHLVIANIELRRDLEELKDALAVREADEGPSGEAAVGLDEIISRLHAVISDLQAVREGKRPGR